MCTIFKLSIDCERKIKKVKINNISKFILDKETRVIKQNKLKSNPFLRMPQHSIFKEHLITHDKQKYIALNICFYV